MHNGIITNLYSPNRFGMDTKHCKPSENRIC